MSQLEMLAAGFLLLASPQIVTSLPTLSEPECKVWAPVPESHGTFFRCVEVASARLQR